MATPNRITIQLNDAGTAVLGMNARDLGGMPVPISGSQFAALFPELNAAALDGVAAKDAALAAKDAALAAKDTEKTAAVAAVVAERDAAHTALAEVKTLASSVEDEGLKAALEAKANDGRRSAEDKEIAALEAKIAADQARLDELNERGGRGIRG